MSRQRPHPLTSATPGSALAAASGADEAAAAANERAEAVARRDVRRLLGTSGLTPRKALGQHFVTDQNTLRRIARLSGVGPGDHVIEVGAGTGSLTVALADQGAAVTAVETDPNLVPILRSVCGSRPVRIIEADALRLDWDTALSTGKSWVLAGNLPYNIAARLIIDVLEEVPSVARIVVLVQTEVAERLAAKVGDPSYSAVSVKASYWAAAELRGTVPPTVFYPRPHVGSSLVELVRRPSPAVSQAAVPYQFLFKLVKAGFAQRRKMLRRSLSGLVTPPAFESSGISPHLRAEDLDITTWGILAACAIQTSRIT